MGGNTPQMSSKGTTQEGIKHELTVPHTPQQNGAAEILNRMLIEGVRTMLVDSKLPHCLLAETLSTYVYIVQLMRLGELPYMKRCVVSRQMQVFSESLDAAPMLTSQRLKDINLILSLGNVCCLATVPLRRAIDSMIPRD